MTDISFFWLFAGGQLEQRDSYFLTIFCLNFKNSDIFV